MAIPAAIMKLAIEGAVTHHAGSVALKSISENMSATPAGRAMKFAAAAAGQGIRADFDDDEVQYMQIHQTDLDCQCDCGPCTECEEKRKANAQHDFAKQVRARERPITPSGDITRGVNVNRRIPRAPRSFAEDSSLRVNKTTPRRPRSFREDRSLRVNKTTPRPPGPFATNPYGGNPNLRTSSARNTQATGRFEHGTNPYGGDPAMHSQTYQGTVDYVGQLRGLHERYANGGQGEMEDLDCQCPCMTCEECDYKEQEEEAPVVQAHIESLEGVDTGLGDSGIPSLPDAHGGADGIGTGDGGTGTGGPGSGGGGA